MMLWVPPTAKPSVEPTEAPTEEPKVRLGNRNPKARTSDSEFALSKRLPLTNFTEVPTEIPTTEPTDPTSAPTETPTEAPTGVTD